MLCRVIIDCVQCLYDKAISLKYWFEVWRGSFFRLCLLLPLFIYLLWWRSRSRSVWLRPSAIGQLRRSKRDLCLFCGVEADITEFCSQFSFFPCIRYGNFTLIGLFVILTSDKFSTILSLSVCLCLFIPRYVFQRGRRFSFQETLT